MDNKIEIKDTTADPAPLGLMGFGMTTVLLNLHNAGFYGLDTMILAMGLCFGGAAQVIAGIMEWKKNNTFGATAFTSYGFFWISLVTLIVMGKLGLAAAPCAKSMAAYLSVWGLFTLGLFIASLKLNRTTQFIFGSLTVLFFLLAYGDYSGDASIKVLAGYEGIICGLSAMYGSMAQVVNGMYGKKVFPL